MWINGIREFFLACPMIFGREINVNYLGHSEGCISLEPVGTHSIVKTYLDGKRVFSGNYRLGIRCAFDANSVLNQRDADFAERIALWIEQQNLIGNLPMLSEDFEAVGISVVAMPHLSESSIQGARMQLEFSLTYRDI